MVIRHQDEIRNAPKPVLLIEHEYPFIVISVRDFRSAAVIYSRESSVVVAVSCIHHLHPAPLHRSITHPTIPSTMRIWRIIPVL